jgi:hypothetical protein
LTGIKLGKQGPAGWHASGRPAKLERHPQGQDDHGRRTANIGHI